MGKISDQYKAASPDDRRSFDRWLTANAFIGSILAAGLIAMAVAGSKSRAPHGVEVAGIEKSATDFIGPVRK